MNATDINREQQGGETLLDPQEINTRDRGYLVYRRVQDAVLSLAALLFLWPLMLLVSIIIVIDSPGASPIFTQKRVGKDDLLKAIFERVK